MGWGGEPASDVGIRRQRRLGGHLSGDARAG